MVKSKIINSISKSEQLIDIIRKNITSGKFPPGQKIPSEYQLSKMYGVNRRTANKAVSVLVAEGFLYRKHGSGTFVAPYSMRKNESKTVMGLFYPEKFSESLAGQIHLFEWLKYFSRVIENSDIELKHIIVPVENQEKTIKNILRKNSINGAIFIEIGELTQCVEILKNAAFPLVVMYDCDDPNTDSVIIDQENGAYQAVTYLIDTTNYPVAIIAGPQFYPGYKKRLQGYFKALRQHHLPRDDRFIGFGSGEKDGYKIMKQFLSLTPKPKSVFCCSDFKAIGAMEAIKEANLRIPHDICVIGFDNIDQSDSTDPPLTTVDIRKYELVKKSVNLLLKQMHKNLSDKKHKPLKQILKPKLIIRKTTCVS